MKKFLIAAILLATASSASAAWTYFLQYEYMYGTNRICVYDNGEHLNFGINLCPLTITR